MHSYAEVDVARADDRVRQLAADLARRGDVDEVVEEAGWTVVRLAAGSCSMTGTGDTLVLDATAPDDATLAVVRDIVGDSLARLAAAEPLRVDWERRPD